MEMTQLLSAPFTKCCIWLTKTPINTLIAPPFALLEQIHLHQDPHTLLDHVQQAPHKQYHNTLLAPLYCDHHVNGHHTLDVPIQLVLIRCVTKHS